MRKEQTGRIVGGKEKFWSISYADRFAGKKWAGIEKKWWKDSGNIEKKRLILNPEK